MKRLPRKLVPAIVLLGIACGGAPAEPKPAKAKLATADGKANVDKSKGDPKPEAQDKAGADPDKEAMAKAAAAVEVNQSGAPPWFNKGLIEHTTVLTESKSEARIDGNHSAMLRLELPEGQTIKGCIGTLHEKIKAHVPELSDIATTPEGDMQFMGNIPGYQVSCMCGPNNEGNLTAAISYSTTN